MESGDETFDCPFCGAHCIKAWKIPPHKEYHTTRGSGQSSGEYHLVPEKITILSGCKECGKSEKEVKNKFEGKREKTREQRCIWCKKPIKDDAENRLECEECV